MCITEESQLLGKINELFASLNLKPLADLGNTANGTIQIIGMPEINEDNKRFFYDFKFPVRFPNGVEGFHAYRTNANSLVSDGAIFVVLINGKLVIIKQWRLVMGRWTFEVPRGFGEKIDNAKVNGKLGTLKIGDLPIANALRELSEEVAQNIVINSITHLGNIASDTGTTANAPAFYLIKATTDPEKLYTAIKARSETDLKVQLWEPSEAWNQIGGKIIDNFSITALAMVKKDFESSKM